jgi:hypothetical protein
MISALVVDREGREAAAPFVPGGVRRRVPCSRRESGGIFKQSCNDA